MSSPKSSGMLLGRLSLKSQYISRRRGLTALHVAVGKFTYYINKRTLVSITFLRTQRSLTFNLTSGLGDLLGCLASKLVSRCTSSTFLYR